MTDQLLVVIPPILQAISVAVTAVFAVLGLRAWRQQLIGKRKIEIAEQALLAIYKVKNALSYIRNPGSMGGEGQSRPGRNDEPEDLARQRDTYFTPLERIQKSNDDFAELEKVQLLCQVFFGHTAARPFKDLVKARHSVRVAATMLLQSIKDQERGRLDPKLWERWSAIIWEGYGPVGDGEGEREDEISRSVNAAVAEIETLCRQHLKL